ncbi:hypothetical protein SBOR_4334 [Sclerotinia borealis F-4128]|uniref:Uncharacterized protein n=1 Tax=Sclerotinia borealis (strain F-4128) TaxID=1432307 RepID=W9CLA2_SCLBF|nr:hypothetical protein SBOR_4334 [Sclerotinia borealis F-4128]
MSQSGSGSNSSPDFKGDSDVATKPSSKSKFKALKKALGFGKKGEMSDREKRKREKKRMKNEIKQEKANFKRWQKEKNIERGREQYSYLQDLRRKSLRLDLYNVEDLKIRALKEMEIRWRVEDELAKGELEDRLRRLKSKEQHQISTANKGEQLRGQESKVTDEISTEEAKSLLRQSPKKSSKLPVVSGEIKPMPSKMRMMMSWDNECCKEWIWDYLEDHYGKYGDRSYLRYQVKHTNWFRGQGMFEMTEEEWEDWLGYPGVLVYWRLQSISVEEGP